MSTCYDRVDPVYDFCLLSSLTAVNRIEMVVDLTYLSSPFVQYLQTFIFLSPP